MKRALLVSPYFVPSTLAGVHRARLLARGLPEFGWEPVVLAVDSAHYGRLSEPQLAELLPDGLRVERVGALRAAVSTRLGITDLSLRAFWTMRRRICELNAAERFDLIFVSVLPGYAGLLGAWAKREFGLPFVLDYQDPWVSDAGAGARLSKARIAHWLAERLEPRFAPIANAITAVSDGTLDSLRKRRLLDPAIPVRIIPIGSDPADHEVAKRCGQSDIRKEQGWLDIAYIGTIAEAMLPVLEALFRSFAQLKAIDPRLNFRLHLIGASPAPAGPDHLGILGMAKENGIAEQLYYQPQRIGYLDALRTMQEADLLLLVGSTNAHYTASKLFPYWLAERPIVGLFHAESSVNEMSRALGGIRLINYRTADDIRAIDAEVAAALREVITQPELLPPRNPAAFEPYSVRGIGAAFGQLFDEVS